MAAAPQYVKDGADQLRGSPLVTIAIGVVDSVHDAVLVEVRNLAAQQNIKKGWPKAKR